MVDEVMRKWSLKGFCKLMMTEQTFGMLAGSE